MASICRDKNGTKRILFVDGNGKRWPIRLGKMPLGDARTIKSHIESLLASKTSGRALDNETAKWVRDMPDGLAEKLAATGLIAKRVNETLGGLIEHFMAANTHFKPSTRSVWGQVTGDLTKHFGDDCGLRNVGQVEAEGFRQWLFTTKKLSATTIAKTLQRSRQLFAHAIRFGLIEKNPFEGVKCKNGNPRERQRYITVEDTERLIDAAPNYAWRTIIALSRYAGLRNPSEVLSLQLDDLNWDRGSMRVTSPKTEGHGQGSRMVPMFERLRPYLLEAAEMAEEGQTHVIPESLYLQAAQTPLGWRNCNQRTTFKKIILRAGLEPWPRLFHNLRASCESDLAREYPITTVCKWLGNTVAVAVRHYVQVTDEDFQKAAGPGLKVAQNAAQSTHASGRKARQTPAMGQKVGMVESYVKPATSKSLHSLAVSCRKSFSDKDLGEYTPQGSNL